MTEQEIRNNVIGLNTHTNSIYDYHTHLPYPTLTHIMNNTGINLVELEGSTHRAEAKVKLLTQKSYRMLVYGRMETTVRDLEYLIATRIHFREEFIRYVINLIGDMFISGDNSILLSDGYLSDELKQRVKIFHSGILDANRYDIGYYEYRKGY